MKNFGKVNMTLDKYLKEHNISRSSLTRKKQNCNIVKYCNSVKMIFKS